jgi:hypothetical protein
MYEIIYSRKKPTPKSYPPLPTLGEEGSEGEPPAGGVRARAAVRLFPFG